MQLGTVRVVTAPAAYPVSMSEAKEFCRVDDDDTTQDRTITMLIAGLTSNAENKLTDRAFVERTLELCFDYQEYSLIGTSRGFFWPGIELPFPPLLAIESIKYTDPYGNEQTMDPGSYEVNAYCEPGRVRPVFGAYWPAVGPFYNAFRIRYQAGYRPVGSPTDLTDNSYIPGQLRSWMSARASTLYDNRVQWQEGRLLEIPRDFADGMLDDLVVASRLF